MYLYGRILGWLIVTGYTLTMLNYAVKLFNRKVMTKLPKDAPVRKHYNAFMRFIIQYHRYFAMFTTFALIAHFIIQYQSWGFFVTGILAGVLLIMQGFLGGYGMYVKKRKSGPWLYVHRTIAVLLLAAILLHVLTAVLS